MVEEYYKTKESVEEYIEMAKDVSGKQLIEKLKQVLLSNSSLLEIGSGPGTDWSILEKTYNVTGSDFSEEFLKHLKAKNPNGEFLKLNAVTLKIEKTFDGIYSNKVLHHLKDDEFNESIIRQYNILNTKGIVCHSFWEGEGSERYNGMFVNYHNKKDLLKTFGKYFDILSIENYKEFEDEDSLLLIAKKK